MNDHMRHMQENVRMVSVLRIVDVSNILNKELVKVMTVLDYHQYRPTRSCFYLKRNVLVTNTVM